MNTKILRKPNGQFARGQSGNSGGVTAHRKRLNEKFVFDLKQVWERKGQAALEKLADRDPGAFCQLVAGLLPKKAAIAVAHRHAYAIEWVEAIKNLPPVGGDIIEVKPDDKTQLPDS